MNPGKESVERLLGANIYEEYMTWTDVYVNVDKLREALDHMFILWKKSSHES